MSMFSIKRIYESAVNTISNGQRADSSKERWEHGLGEKNLLPKFSREISFSSRIYILLLSSREKPILFFFDPNLERILPAIIFEVCL